jgi:thioester reductase-like protein
MKHFRREEDMALPSQSTQRLAQLSPLDKHRLLAHLLREKAKRQGDKQAHVEPQGWMRDGVLDPDIQPVGPASRSSEPTSVLLTGATGFLGAHLLQDLRKHSRATIYCLVRARDEVEGRRRLETNFGRYFAQPLDFDHVRPVLGDIAQPQLGLSLESYGALAQEIDVIVHNGAQLHHLARYAQLKAGNVDSTVTLLRLAATAKPKWVHYVSTLVAAVDRDPGGWLVENFPKKNPTELAGGYAQSKWVSEKLLAEAARRGIGVTVFRPGFISGRSDSGAWPAENDHLLRLIKGCLQMGYASESELMPNMAPVDFVSEAIVRIALSPATTGQVFNISNPHLVSWEMLVAWLQGAGYPLKVVSNDIWREKHLSRVSKDNALFPLLPLYLGGDTTERYVGLLSKLAKVRNDGTAQMLRRLQMSFPTIDQALWERYVRFFQQCGFFEPPR